MTSCCSGRPGRSGRRRSTSFGPTRTASASSRSRPAAATRRCWPRRRSSSASPWSAVSRGTATRTSSSRCMPRRSGAAITTATSRCRASSSDPTRAEQVAGAAVRHRAQRDHRRRRAAADPGRAGQRCDAGAGQQGVADHRRRRWSRSLAKPGQIVPVDSEHSALAQCLRGGRADEVRKLVLTASGGPFRGRTRAELADVTADEALAHPTWDMGPMVTMQLLDPGQQGTRGDRGAPACSGSTSTGSRSSCIRSR